MNTTYYLFLQRNALKHLYNTSLKKNIRKVLKTFLKYLAFEVEKTYLMNMNIQWSSTPNWSLTLLLGIKKVVHYVKTKPS